MKIEDLAKPFPPENISWRVQGKPYERNGQHSAMALAYIDARDVMDKFDDVCGSANWQSAFEVMPNGLTICKIGVRIGDGWVWKSDGAGETAVEGKKGGVSDALKRAAVHWGVGRYLYRLSTPWVKCDVRNGKNGQTAWKSWAEDPWSKVSKVSYVKAEDELKNGAVENAIAAIGRETTMEGLGAYWQNLANVDKSTALKDEVIAAKDNRKKELTKDNG